MPIVRHFIRHVSPQTLKSYFSNRNIAVSGVDWNQDRAVVAKNIIQLVDHMTDEQQARLHIDAERICHMADEFGEAALLSVVPDRESLMALPGRVERSHWVYVNDPLSFTRAENIQLADRQRGGRHWDGYEAAPGSRLAVDTASIETFKRAVRSQFKQGEKVLVELFDRYLMDKGERRVVQVMVYQERLPDTALEFVGEDIQSSIRRPVLEYALTYAPETGVIEVTAPGCRNRTVVAQTFATELLKQPASTESIPLRQYSLMPLKENQPLPTDPEDGIESVEVVMLKLQNEERQGAITLDYPRRFSGTLHEFADQVFGDRNPLQEDNFTPVQAKLSIRFQPENGSNRKTTLSVKISLPNRCDLRNRTERERLIGEKYLKRWGF